MSSSTTTAAAAAAAAAVACCACSAAAAPSPAAQVHDDDTGIDEDTADTLSFVDYQPERYEQLLEQRLEVELEGEGLACQAIRETTTADRSALCALAMRVWTSKGKRMRASNGCHAYTCVWACGRTGVGSRKLLSVFQLSVSVRFRPHAGLWSWTDHRQLARLADCPA